jgi:hypothetical protein
MNSKILRKKMIRHGEVLLLPVDEIPAETPHTFTGNEFIVAHSETGHHHVAVGNVTVFGTPEKMYLKVNKNSVIEHRKTFEKHETKTLFKGLYTVIIKESYDYFTKAMARVRD